MPSATAFVKPSEAELDQLMDIVLAAYPSLAPPLELSFVERLTARNTGIKIEPDAARIRAEFRREVESAFVAIGAMKICDEPDRKHYIGHHVDVAQAWLRSFNMFTDISRNAFIVAALAHGVPFTDGSKEYREVGAVWELGLSQYAGTPVTDGWKTILANGKPHKGVPLSSDRRLPAPSPSRVY